jgi:hypothetical protein
MKFFAADWLVGNEALGHQEPAGREAVIGRIEAGPARRRVAA